MRKPARPIPTLSDSDKARFASKTTPGSIPENAEGPCLVWTDCRDRKGYGIFSIKAKMFLAHRIAFTIEHEAPPPEMMVLHKCDNPSCVRPSHLFLGTNTDNVADMVRKGRGTKGRTVPMEKRTKGARVHSAKLTDEKAIEAIAAYKGGGLSQREVGEMFGIHQSNVSLLVNGKAWKHATEAQPTP